MLTGESLPVAKTAGRHRHRRLASTRRAASASRRRPSASRPRWRRSSRWCRTRRPAVRRSRIWPTRCRRSSCRRSSRWRLLVGLFWYFWGAAAYYHHESPLGTGADLHGHRAAHLLPVCAGSGHADRDHGRHRCRRRTWHPDQECRGAAEGRRHQHRRAGQDRHDHQGEAGGDGCRGGERREWSIANGQLSMVNGNGVIPHLSSGHAVTDSPRRSCCTSRPAPRRASEHPLAEAIVEQAKAEGVALSEVEAFNSITGRGIEATVDGQADPAGQPGADG